MLESVFSPEHDMLIGLYTSLHTVPLPTQYAISQLSTLFNLYTKKSSGSPYKVPRHHSTSIIACQLLQHVASFVPRSDEQT